MREASSSSLIHAIPDECPPPPPPRTSQSFGVPMAAKRSRHCRTSSVDNILSQGVISTSSTSQRSSKKNSSTGNILTVEDPDEGRYLAPRQQRRPPGGHYPQGHTSIKLRSSYHYERHPLSHSTTSILNESTNDPHPIIPNKHPGTPDVWLPLKA